jgi:CRISPR-associated exonuclease Cas4
METATIEVTDLKQWRYCPRIVWYRYCLPAIRPITDGMRHGIERHTAEAGREARRSLRSYGLQAGERTFDLQIRSAQLGLRGRLDLAIAVPDHTSPDSEAIVVEYKDSEERPGPHVRLQLTAYALLIEELWHLPVRTGYIYQIPLRQATRIGITAALRAKATAAIHTIQVAIGNEAIPDPPASRRQCVTCEFRRFCNDVV